MFIAVPLCVVDLLECLLCLYIERAPAVVQVLKNLVGGDVKICCQAMAELRIILFVEGIA